MALLAAQALVTGSASAQAPTQATRSVTTSSTCSLSNGIQHVIYVQFDNTHLFQDRPGVRSDLEQMPNLLNFLTNNGTLSDNEHTILISHTAGGILSSLTGLYPDRNGITVQLLPLLQARRHHRVERRLQVLERPRRRRQRRPRKQ